MNVRLASLIACAAIAPAFFSAAQAQSEIYFNGFEDYTLGSMGAQGLGQGWYVENTVEIVNGNSLFAPTGSKSAKLAGAGNAGGRLRLYFADRTLGGSQVTGALGRNLSGDYAKNLTFSWDFISTSPALNSNPTFGFYNAAGGTFQPVNAAVLFDIRWNTQKLQYADGVGKFAIHDDYVFKANKWYNFVVSNINTSSQTYDLLVYEHGIADAVVSISGAGFYANIQEIEAFRIHANTTSGLYSYNIDNFTITQIPESSTYALLIGFSAVALLGLRRRLKR